MQIVRRSNRGAFFLGAIAGGLVGALVALLMAPRSGEQTQAEIKARALDLKDEADRLVEEGRQSFQTTAMTARDGAADSMRRSARTLYGLSRKLKTAGEREEEPETEGRPANDRQPAAVGPSM